MKYNENLAARVRLYFGRLPMVEEKEMFSGLVFMVDQKMCVGVLKTELMVRIDPQDIELALEKDGCQQMMMKGRLMKGYVLVDENVIQQIEDLAFWLALALAFNPTAKASPKKKQAVSKKEKRPRTI